MDKQTEYITLSNQILALEKNAFERTLLIGFVGFPCLGILDNGFYYWIPFLIMIFLMWNYSYTTKNLKKSIQMKTYIQVFLREDIHFINWYSFLEKRENFDSKKLKQISSNRHYEKDSFVKRLETWNTILIILYFIIAIIFTFSEVGREKHFIEDTMRKFPLSGIIFAFVMFIISLTSLNENSKVSFIKEQRITETIFDEITKVKTD